jgi:hypothetical protein
VWRHPVKVNAAAMHAMAMMICFFMICDGCDVFCLSARSAAQHRALLRGVTLGQQDQQRLNGVSSRDGLGSIILTPRAFGSQL